MTATTLEAALAAHPFFRALSERHREKLAECALVERFPEGMVLLREGGRADRFFALVEGRVALELHVPGPGSLVVDTLGPGDVVGVSWLFPPYRWQFDAKVVEPVEAIVLDAAHLRQCCDEDHDLGYYVVTAVAAVAARRLQSTRVRLMDVYGR